MDVSRDIPIGNSIRKTALLIAFVAGCMTAALAPANEGSKAPLELPAKENFHLFLLLGQSNMSGRGKIEKEDKVPHPRVLALDANDRWVPAVDPIHFDKSGVGVGLGRTFGIVVAENDPAITVGLIPCAVSGTGIEGWRPNRRLHRNAIRRVRIAMDAGVIRGILWHQGEHDGHSPPAAEAYSINLTEVIASFRTELDAPTLPFIVGGLRKLKKTSQSRLTVEIALRDLPQTVPDTAYVASDGLRSAKSNNTHFDGPSLREFGRRYAKAYLAFNNAPQSRRAPDN